MAWLHVDYNVTAATANSTTLATLFGPADLEGLAYGAPTPSSGIAPTITGTNHSLATPLAQTTELATTLSLTALSLVQPW